MITQTLNRLNVVLEVVPPLLQKINEEEFSRKTSLEKWSKKEVLGHLLDSATNNHQRFVRCQYENYIITPYEQNQLVRVNHYQALDTTHIINFWTIYNKHLLEIIRYMPSSNLDIVMQKIDGSKITLMKLVEEYVEHLEHHLQQIVEY